MWRARGGACQFPEFYDAMAIGFYGLSGLDYTLIPHMTFICKDVANAKADDPLFGTHLGPGAMCARSIVCRSTHSCSFDHASSG
jgi:hypothetical protein